jgi:UDP-N-acetylmuramoylalanine-D-glutamate ligase
LGENSDKILKYCTSLELFFSKADSMNEAVQIATYVGQSGDVVLFSPACQCETENYIKRGNEFKQVVKELSI